MIDVSCRHPAPTDSAAHCRLMPNSCGVSYRLKCQMAQELTHTLTGWSCFADPKEGSTYTEQGYLCSLTMTYSHWIFHWYLYLIIPLCSQPCKEELVSVRDLQIDINCIWLFYCQIWLKELMSHFYTDGHNRQTIWFYWTVIKEQFYPN